MFSASLALNSSSVLRSFTHLVNLLIIVSPSDTRPSMFAVHVEISSSDLLFLPPLQLKLFCTLDYCIQGITMSGD